MNVGCCVSLRMMWSLSKRKLCSCLPCLFVALQPMSMCRALKSPRMIECLYCNACLSMSFLRGVLCLVLVGGTKYVVM